MVRRRRSPGRRPVAFLALFYLWPFATLDRHARLDARLDRRHTPAAARRGDVLWFTTRQAVASTLLTPRRRSSAPAWAVSRFDLPRSPQLPRLSVLTAVFVLPTVVDRRRVRRAPPLVGLDRSVWAILGAHVVFNLAVVVRTVGRGVGTAPASTSSTPPRRSAPGTWRTFRYVTLPLLRPSLAAAASIVFLFTFTSYGVDPRARHGRASSTIEVEVWRRATQLGDLGGAATLAVVQLVVLAVLVVVGDAGHSDVTARTIDLLADPSRRRRPRGRTSGGGPPCSWEPASALVLVAAPLVALVDRSFRDRDGPSGGCGLAAWRTLGDTEIRPGLSARHRPDRRALETRPTTAVWATVFAVADRPGSRSRRSACARDAAAGCSTRA